MPEQEHQSNDNRLERDIAVLAKEVEHIRDDIKEIKELLKTSANQFVSGKELEDKLDPIRRIVYGMTAAVLLSFIGAVIALVWKTTS